MKFQVIHELSFLFIYSLINWKLSSFHLFNQLLTDNLLLIRQLFRFRVLKYDRKLPVAIEYLHDI